MQTEVALRLMALPSHAANCDQHTVCCLLSATQQGSQLCDVWHQTLKTIFFAFKSKVKTTLRELNLNISLYEQVL